MNATTTTPTRQRKPRPKPVRTIRLCVKPTAETAGVVRIAVGHAEQDYILTEIPADFGRGFLVEKIGHVETYAVNIDADRRTCECQGYNRWQKCKHSDGWPL